MSDKFPVKIRVTDLGDFLRDNPGDDMVEYDDILLLSCLTDDGGAICEAPEHYELMQEMAMRYNAYTELVAALEWILASNHPQHPEFGVKSPVRPKTLSGIFRRLRSRAAEGLKAVKKY